MMQRILTVLLLLTGNLVYGQIDFQTRLGGFMLGQYRDCPSNQFGKPIVSEKYDDGFEYEIFLVKPDTSVYMIFEYSPENLKAIWSIQITGTNHDPAFLGLSLGMNKDDFSKKMGIKPSSKQDIGEYGTKLVFDEVNYSFEIDTQDKLSSIKLIDESYQYFNGPNKVEKIPGFAEVKALLNSGNNSRISSILSPDVEVYFNDSTYRFQHPIQLEIKEDQSNVFELISSFAKTISDITPGDTTAYEENVRLSQGQNPMHVIKFSEAYPIHEIVFKYQFDQYMLWEYSIRKN